MSLRSAKKENDLKKSWINVEESDWRHKIQGNTIKKHECLRKRLEPTITYLLLSRIQELKQLFILKSLPEKNINIKKWLKVDR